ncbi:MAG: toprim domain-containing protein, partial [Acidimicrobiales bacterium]
PPEGQPPSPEFAEWIERCTRRLWHPNHPGATQARAWLTERGYEEQTLRDARVGYDPGADRDTHWPRERRQTHGIPTIAGVTFPLYDRAGTLTYAQTRNLRWTPESRWPKYVNPTRIVTNPAIAYWADPGQHAGRPVLIVEGPTDALAARQTHHDVAALIGAGHATNPAVVDQLVEAFGLDRPFIIMTDPDPAGRNAAQQLLAHLRQTGAPAVRHEPDGGDLAAWTQHHNDPQAEIDTAIVGALRALSTTNRRALTPPSDASLAERSFQARGRSPLSVRTRLTSNALDRI